MEIQDIPDQNLFLLDWLTFVVHGASVHDCKVLLGVDSPDIPWEDVERFQNGYPLRCTWNGISIYYGADDGRFYKDPSKARPDMGICVNLSGTGCRAFETYGHGNWFSLLSELFTLRPSGWRRKKDGTPFSYHITRLDLAYDDHEGLFDLYVIRSHAEDRLYRGKCKYSENTFSDDQNKDIQGLTCQFGHNSSDIKVRIYDKAAERGFKDRHWVRCEIQLRDDLASNAASELIRLNDIGKTVSGILRNYLMFVIPSNDSNKSRWPVALWWEIILENMDRIKLWSSPGQIYNLSNTEHWLVKQYGQAIVVLDSIHDPGYLIDRCKQLYPLSDLSPKYKQALNTFGFSPRPFDYIKDNSDIDSIFTPEQLSFDFVRGDHNDN